MRAFFILLILGSIVAQAETEFNCKKKYLELGEMIGLKKPKIYYLSLADGTIYNSYEDYFQSESYRQTENKIWDRRVSEDYDEKYRKLSNELAKVDEEIELERNPTLGKLKHEENVIREKQDADFGKFFMPRIRTLEKGCKDKFEAACDELKKIDKDVKNFDGIEKILLANHDEQRKNQFKGKWTSKTNKANVLRAKREALLDKKHDLEWPDANFSRRLYGMPKHINDQLEAIIFAEKDAEVVKVYHKTDSAQLREKLFKTHRSALSAREAVAAFPEDKTLKVLLEKYDVEEKKLENEYNAYKNTPPHYLVAHMDKEDGLISAPQAKDDAQLGISANCQFYNPHVYFSGGGMQISDTCNNANDDICKIARRLDLEIKGQRFLGFLKNGQDHILKMVGRGSPAPADVKQAQ